MGRKAQSTTSSTVIGIGLGIISSMSRPSPHATTDTVPAAATRLRRCHSLFIEARQDSQFELAALLRDGTALVERRSWVALLPHRGEEVPVETEELLVIAELSANRWQTLAQLAERFPLAILRGLIGKGILVAESLPGDSADRSLRQLGWHPLSALAHLMSRWVDVDTVASARHGGFAGIGDKLQAMGPPPPNSASPSGCADDVALPSLLPRALDELLQRRATCRNFDPQRSLPLTEVARLLDRTLRGRDPQTLPGGLRLLKKNAPSAGALHPTEGYLIAQRIEGLAPGIYHYNAEHHRLRPLRREPAESLRDLILTSLAGQDWFADAPCLLALTFRFERLLWKYRGHAKAYRAALLDVGHVSQLLYLAATEMGWGAFVTSAINDRNLENLLGLDPLREGTIAVTGFGERATRRSFLEFDQVGDTPENRSD